MEKAAAAGDFVKKEVVPVMKALVESGIEWRSTTIWFMKSLEYFYTIRVLLKLQAGEGAEVRTGTDLKNDETPKMKPLLAAYLFGGLSGNQTTWLQELRDLAKMRQATLIKSG
jgi:hypothetical protein